MGTFSLIFHFNNLCLKRMNEKSTSKSRLSSSISHNCGNSALDFSFFRNHASSKFSKLAFQTESSPDRRFAETHRRQTTLNTQQITSTISWWRQASNLGSEELSLIPGVAICSSSQGKVTLHAKSLFLLCRLRDLPISCGVQNQNENINMSGKQ